MLRSNQFDTLLCRFFRTIFHIPAGGGTAALLPHILRFFGIGRFRMDFVRALSGCRFFATCCQTQAQRCRQKQFGYFFHIKTIPPHMIRYPELVSPNRNSQNRLSVFIIILALSIAWNDRILFSSSIHAVFSSSFIFSNPFQNRSGNTVNSARTNRESTRDINPAINNTVSSAGIPITKRTPSVIPQAALHAKRIGFTINTMMPTTNSVIMRHSSF